MNRYNSLIKVLLGSLLVVNAFLIWQNKSKVQPISNPIPKQTVTNALQEDLALCTYFENLTMGQELEDSDIQSTHDEIKLKNHLGNSGIVIFRYNEIHCDICVDSTILILNELQDKMDTKNLVYLTTYKNVRDKVNFQRMNKITSPIYNIEKLDIELEAVGRPYVLHLDNKLRIVGAMIADKDQLFRLRAFTNSLKEKFIDS